MDGCLVGFINKSQNDHLDDWNLNPLCAQVSYIPTRRQCTVTEKHQAIEYTIGAHSQKDHICCLQIDVVNSELNVIIIH